MELEGLLVCPQVAATGPYLSKMRPVHTFPACVQRLILKVFK
jgi:hypothetical protein